MAQVIDRKFDAVQKLEIVTIEDEFGAQMILQHPLLADGYDPDAEEQSALGLMQANADKFRAKIQERQAKHAQLQSPNDHGRDTQVPHPGSKG